MDNREEQPRAISEAIESYADALKSICNLTDSDKSCIEDAFYDFAAEHRKFLMYHIKNLIEKIGE